MPWFNIFGAAFMAVIMVPNIIFACKCPGGFVNKWHNRAVETAEQIGRFGCFGFMVVNVPGACFGWWSDEAFALYLLINAALVLLYCVIWAVCFKKSSVFRALALSILPSLVFLCSGVLSRNVPLGLAALLFAPCHILLSYKNATAP